MNKYKEWEHCDKLKAAKGFFCVNENLCTDKSVKNFVKKIFLKMKKKKKIQSSYKLTSLGTGLGAAGKAA